VADILTSEFMEFMERTVLSLVFKLKGKCQSTSLERAFAGAFCMGWEAKRLQLSTYKCRLLLAALHSIVNGQGMFGTATHHQTGKNFLQQIDTTSKHKDQPLRCRKCAKLRL